MSEDIGERVARRLLEVDYETFAPIFMPDGSAPHTMWPAEDGWYVSYTTKKVDGGRWHGRYVAMAYRPYGKGARGGRGKAESWRRVYARPFSTRKAAKARAMDLYAEHSPKWFARNGGKRWWR